MKYMDDLLISEDILINAGFEYLQFESDILKNYQKETYGVENFKIFGKLTNDEIPIKLDIDNGYNNRGSAWHLHVDNESCETIGCADIDTVEQFNKLMEVFESSFRL